MKIIIWLNVWSVDHCYPCFRTRRKFWESWFPKAIYGDLAIENLVLIHELGYLKTESRLCFSITFKDAGFVRKGGGVGRSSYSPCGSELFRKLCNWNKMARIWRASGRFQKSRSFPWVLLMKEEAGAAMWHFYFYLETSIYFAAGSL